MTEAQRAHLHMLETWPSERITTHTKPDQPYRDYNWRHLGRRVATARRARSPASIIVERRKIIKANAPILTRHELAALIRISLKHLDKYLREMGLQCKRSPRFLHAAETRDWLRANSTQHTVPEISEILQLNQRSVNERLVRYKLVAKSLKADRREKRMAWLKENGESMTSKQSASLLKCNKEHVSRLLKEMGMKALDGRSCKYEIPKL